MALKDTFNIAPKYAHSSEADLTSYLPKKKIGLKSAKIISLKKEYLLYCD